jgi:shikimate dehydrogenase
MAGFALPFSDNPWILVKKYGVSGSYGLLPVPPDETSHFFANLPVSGANVTIPYKETAFHCVDETDEQARWLGAVNTIYGAFCYLRAESVCP